MDNLSSCGSLGPRWVWDPTCRTTGVESRTLRPQTVVSLQYLLLFPLLNFAFRSKAEHEEEVNPYYSLGLRVRV